MTTELNDLSPPLSAEVQTPTLDIQIIADRTTGYAAIQNHVPVARALFFQNNGLEPLVDIEVVIRCSPGFAVGLKLKFERIMPGESRRISPIDLQPNHEYLSRLNEAERASISALVTSRDKLIAEVSKDIEVLAYDQWAGTRSLPELLAAFCMPNSRVVDNLIANASTLLREAPGDFSMNGYQSKNREKVWKQVSAVYSAILGEQLHYSNPPASFGTDGQKIRTPERVLDGRVATCLDTAMLFASCFEQVGLHPVVLFKEGHAWVAEILIRAPKIPLSVARSAHEEESRTKLASLVLHGKERVSARSALGGAYRDEVASLNAAELKLQWVDADTTWWPRKWFAKRAVLNRLRLYRTDGQRPTENSLSNFISSLARLNAEDRFVDSMAVDARNLLQEGFVGENTDWNAVAKSEEWAKEFAGVVYRLGGSDSELLKTLRANLQVLVAEERGLLNPNAVVGAALYRYRDAYRGIIGHMEKLVLTGECAEMLGLASNASGVMPRLLTMMQEWQTAARQLQPWSLWQRVRADAIAQSMTGLVGLLEAGEVAMTDAAEFFEYSYQCWWLKKAVDNEPVLCTFSSADHERKIAEFRQADERFQKLSQQFIVAKLSGQIPASAGIEPGADSELGRLRRELQKQRKHMPIRQLMQTLPTLLPKLKPCMLMSPLSVAQYLDPAHAQFDVVVFDEASQIPVWDAVGAIARGRQLVCVGDPKQLPPTNFFNRVDDSDEGVGDENIQDLESILDECMSIGPRWPLQIPPPLAGSNSPRQDRPIVV